MVTRICSKGKNDPHRSPGPAWKWDDKEKKWWSHGYDITLADGTRRRESGFFSQADAEAAVGRIRLAEKEKKYGFISEASRPTLASLIEKRLAGMPTRRERVRSERVLGDFQKLLPKKIKVDEVTTAHIRWYVEKRLGLVSPQSVNRELNIISATLRAAEIFYPVLAQWLPPRIPRPKHSKRRRERVIMDEEKDSLLAHLLAPQGEEESASRARQRRLVGLVVNFALLTGMRHGEIDKLKWEHLDLKAKTLKVIGTKTENVTNATRYIAPLTETMLMILRERREQSIGKYIFTISGSPMANFYSILRAACEACGIPYGRDVAGGVVLHDARHTATTRLLQAGVDLSTIQSFTGHSDKEMVLHYGHATPQSRERAARALEDYAGNHPSEEKRSREDEFRRRVYEELGNEVGQSTLDQLISSFMKEFGESG
jgi:integrase